MKTIRLNTKAQDILNVFSEEKGLVCINFEKMMHKKSKRDQTEFHAAQKKAIKENNKNYLRLIA